MEENCGGVQSLTWAVEPGGGGLFGVDRLRTASIIRAIKFEISQFFS
jgi:hypothetical protein